MRRLRITTTVLLLITLQVAGMASAMTMGCPQQTNGQRQAIHPQMVVTIPAAHQHCQQHQDQPRQRSGCDTGCTCLGPCAGGLAAMLYTQYTIDSDLSHHWSASRQALASLAKPLAPFRPPITSAT